MESARERRLKKKVAVKQVLHLFGCLRGCEALGIFSRAPRGHETSKTPAPSVEAAWNKRVKDKHTTRLYFIFYLRQQE